MLTDAKAQSSLYQPGPLWTAKTKNGVKEIHRTGLANFRGPDSIIGSSYADNILEDYRNTLISGKEKLIKLLTSQLYPIRNFFDTQVRLTQFRVRQMMEFAGELFRLSPRANHLLDQYTIPYSLLGGCTYTVEMRGQQMAMHYLDLLDQHDYFTRSVKFDQARSLFEIGGGFGVYIHLLAENYKKLRKFIFLELPPNLYVATQYLKAFYGDHVYDYGRIKDLNKIRFENNDELEIFCIAPWQIELVDTKVDIVSNSHSYVEMPGPVLENYSKQLQRVNDFRDLTIIYNTYNNYDPGRTMDPDKIQGYFNPKEFSKEIYPSIYSSKRSNVFYVSDGKLRV
jgi:putative sugar O-methyltransferase